MPKESWLSKSFSGMKRAAARQALRWSAKQLGATPGMVGFLGGSSIGARKSTDRIIKQDLNKILWGRKLDPKTLWGVYDSESWVYACVDEIACWVVADGWEVYPKIKRPSRENFQRVQAFMDAPNPDGDTMEDIAIDIMTDCGVLGDSILEKGREEGTGEFAALYTLESSDITVLTDTAGGILEYIEKGDKDEDDIHYAPENIIRVKRTSRGRNLFGASPLRPLFIPVTTDLFAQSWNRARFENMGASRKVYIHDEEMGEEQVLFNQTRLDEMKGTTETGSDLVLWGKIDIKDYEDKHTEMGYEGLRKFNRSEILAVYHVPPALLGIIEGPNLGDGKGDSQIRKFRKGTVNPWKRRISAKLERDIVVEEMGITDWGIRLKMDDMTMESDFVENHTKLVQSGIEFAEEARPVFGLKELEDIEPTEEEEVAERRRRGRNNEPPSGDGEEEVERGLSTRKAEPIGPLTPKLEPAVLKMRSGILSVNRRWRGRVLHRFDRLTRGAGNKVLSLTFLVKAMFDTKAAVIAMEKQDVDPDLFREDIQEEDLKSVVLASMGTAAKAGITFGATMGGSAEDAAFSSVRVTIEARAANFAAEVATETRSKLADVIVTGAQQGLPIPEIRRNIEGVFDEPKSVDVAPILDEDGNVIRRAHTRFIDARTWAAMVARTEAALAASEGSLASFAMAGITKVKWVTANRGVDPVMCAPQKNKIFNLADIIGKNLIPAHPNCRCAWVPVADASAVTGDIGELVVNAGGI